MAGERVQGTYENLSVVGCGIAGLPVSSMTGGAEVTGALTRTINTVGCVVAFST